MRGSRWGTGTRGSDPLWKITKIQFFLAILVLIPLKSQSYQASIQCWAVISAIKTGRRWSAFSGILIISPLINQKTKTKNKKAKGKTTKQTKKEHVRAGPPLTKLSGIAHALCISALNYTFYFKEMIYYFILLKITEQLKKNIK